MCEKHCVGGTTAEYQVLHMQCCDQQSQTARAFVIMAEASVAHLALAGIKEALSPLPCKRTNEGFALALSACALLSTLSDASMMCGMQKH
jgi:hypothetical protein